MSEEHEQDGPPRAVFSDGRLQSCGVVDDLTMGAINTELDRLRNESARLASAYGDALSFYKLLLGTIGDHVVH